MSLQLDLFAARPASAPQPDDERWTYYFGLPDRRGAAQYIVLVWGPGDPDRKDRPKKMADDPEHSKLWKKIAKVPAEEWRARIVAHLADGEPRTFNRTMIEIAGVDASVAFGKSPEAGLWLAIEREEIGYTRQAPIYFLHASFIERASPSDARSAA